MIKTITIGQKINGVAQTSKLMMLSGDKILLVDATTGLPPKKVTTKMVGKDLHIFADGATEPSAILGDYSEFSASSTIQGIAHNGAYYNYIPTDAGVMELSSSPVAPAVAKESSFISSAGWWGLGILALGGGVAAAAGGGGGGGGSSATTTTTPTTSTQTAVLVDSLVQGVAYTTSSGLSGVTGVNGTFNYKAGDTVTFKVGNATLGTSVAVPADGIVTLQDIVGVARTNTTDSRVVNLAQFLQSLDNDTDPTNGIIIDPTDANAVTSTINVQTANDTALLAALPTGTTLVTETAATNHLEETSGDTIAPTATSISFSDTTLNATETSTVTIVFSEAVVGLTLSDITVPNATLSNLTTTDSITFTATLTPTANTSDATNVLSIAAGSYTDAASNAGTIATSGNYIVDTAAAAETTPPTALITLSDTTLTFGETSTVTIRFSEAVKDFDINDLSATSGTLSNLSTSDNITWTALLTPPNVESTKNLITLATTYTDNVGNTGTTALSAEYTIDTKSPILTITDNEPNITANMDGSNADGQPDTDGVDILYTFTFSEAVKNFTTDDIVITHGSKKTFTKVSDSIYTLGVTPETAFEGTMSVDTSASDAVDLAGNPIDTTNPSTLLSLQVVDTLAPVLTDTVFDGANDWTYDYVNKTISFTLDSTLEAVNMSNPGGFNVYINTHLISVEAVSMLGNTVTLIMPKAVADDWTSIDSVRVVYKDVTTDLTPAIQDLAGNDATSFTYIKPDVTPPSVTSIIFNDTYLNIGQSSLVTISFSEEIRDVVVSFQNGTLSALAPTADASVWTATFTASADVELATSTFSVSAGNYHDLNGLAGETTTDYTYYVDTRAPSVTIRDDEPAATANIAGANILYTFTFSEAVTNFTLEDVKITGGTAGTFTSISGSVYTLEVIPTPDFVGNITVDVAASKAYDSMGNANTAADQSLQAVDFKAPSVTITMSDSIVTVGETPTVTFTFSEAVLGFDLSDVTYTSGALSNLASSDGGVTYTALFSPTADIEDITNTFTLNTAYTDKAGNTGSSATSGNYIVDTQAPIDTGVTFNNTNDTITITFDQHLDKTNHAQASDFYVTDGSTTTVDGVVTINQINVVGVGIVNESDGTSKLILSMEPMVAGNWKVSYTDIVGNTLNAIQDLYGSDATGFSYSQAVI